MDNWGGSWGDSWGVAWSRLPPIVYAQPFNVSISYGYNLLTTTTGDNDIAFALHGSILDTITGENNIDAATGMHFIDVGTTNE